MKLNRNWLLLVSLCAFSACEEEFSPDEKFFKEKLVVECIIENGNDDLPVFAIITKSFPFYSNFNIDQVNKAFVHNADVRIEWNDKVVRLHEFCLSTLPEDIRRQILKQFGFNPDSVKANFCAYVDIDNAIEKRVGVKYTIKVSTATDSTFSHSVLPAPNALDSIWFDAPPGKPKPDFAQLHAIINDPAEEANFYRYYTGTQNEAIIPNFSSVLDDPIFNGKKFKTPINKAVEPGAQFEENAGLFRRGDTALIKWCAITHAQFEFWTTLETSRIRQGPFASYIRIKGNMNNALGIFGLQSCITYSVPVPK